MLAFPISGRPRFRASVRDDKPNVAQMCVRWRSAASAGLFRRAVEIFGTPPARCLATETRTPFRPHEHQKQEQGGGALRLAIIVGSCGLLTAIALLPANYYGTDKIPVPPDRNTWSSEQKSEKK